MPIICQQCGKLIDEDEGNLEEHTQLAHEELIYVREPMEIIPPITIEEQEEADLYAVNNNMS